MAEENQVQQVTTKEPQQVTTKEPQRVTTKDPKKVEAGRRLAAHNHKRRELKAQSEAASRGVNQYCGIGAVLAVGVIGSLGYYIYQAKQPSHTQSNNPPHHPPKQLSPQTNKFKMD